MQQILLRDDRLCNQVEELDFVPLHNSSCEVGSNIGYVAKLVQLPSFKRVGGDI